VTRDCVYSPKCAGPRSTQPQQEVRIGAWGIPEGHQAGSAHSIQCAEGTGILENQCPRADSNPVPTSVSEA
jgi:hypothetical protein